MYEEKEIKYLKRKNNKFFKKKENHIKELPSLFDNIDWKNLFLKVFLFFFILILIIFIANRIKIHYKNNNVLTYIVIKNRALF